MSSYTGGAAPVRGVIFDLDGTLYRMRPLMRPLLTLLLFPHCLRLPRFLHERNFFAGKDLGSREMLMQAVSEALAKAEKKAPEKIHSWIENAFYPAFVKIMPLFRNSRPQLQSLLQALAGASLKLAVLSDYSRVSERLDKLAIDRSLFHLTTSSEESGALKPSGKPFTAIADSWEMDPSEIIVVGDRIDTDGAAASAAKMQFLHVCDSAGTRSGHRWPAVVSHLLSVARVNPAGTMQGCDTPPRTGII